MFCLYASKHQNLFKYLDYFVCSRDKYMYTYVVIATKE